MKKNNKQFLIIVGGMILVVGFVIGVVFVSNKVSLDTETFGGEGGPWDVWKSGLEGRAILERDSTDVVLIGQTATASDSTILEISGNSYFDGTASISGAINLGNLVSCDTIDSDANGLLSCGTDATGSGTEIHGLLNSDYFNDVLTASASEGALILGVGTTWTPLGIGASSSFLMSNGTTALWNDYVAPAAITYTASNPLTISGTNITIDVASAGGDGYLDSGDWTRFDSWSIASTSYVPYTGATGDVDLGGYNLILGDGGNTGLEFRDSGNVNLWSALYSFAIDTLSIYQGSGANYTATLNMADLTANQTFAFPNFPGTFAIIDTDSNLALTHASISDDLTIGGDDISFINGVASISSTLWLGGDLTGVRASLSDSLTLTDILHAGILTDGTATLTGGAFTGLTSLTSTLGTFTHASISDDLTITGTASISDSSTIFKPETDSTAFFTIASSGYVVGDDYPPLFRTDTTNETITVNPKIILANGSGSGISMSSGGNAYNLDYLTYAANTTDQGISVTFAPNGAPTGFQYNFQFSTASTYGTSLVINGSGTAKKHVIATSNDTAGNNPWPLVIRSTPSGGNHSSTSYNSITLEAGIPTNALYFRSVVDPLGISSNSYIGIGDGSPDFGLEVVTSSSTGYFAISGNTTAAGSGDGDKFIIDGNGYVGIGTTSPDYTLEVDGTASISGQLNLGDLVSSGLFTGVHASISDDLTFNSEITLSQTIASFSVPFTAENTIDFSGASSMKIPIGASLTLNAEGQVVIDNTENQIVYYSSGDTLVLTASRSYAWGIASGSAGLLVDGATLPYDVTLASASCHSGNVDGEIWIVDVYECDGGTGTCGEHINTASVSCDSNITSFALNDTAGDEGDFYRFKIQSTNDACEATDQGIITFKLMPTRK